MYELTVWQGNEVTDWGVKKDVKLVVHPMYLDEENEKGFLGSVLKEDSERAEGIDITELHFVSSLRSADKLDYTFAVISGALSSAVNYVVVGKRTCQSCRLI